MHPSLLWRDVAHPRRPAVPAMAIATAADTPLRRPDADRWPLDASRPILELTDVSLGFAGRSVLRGLDLAIVPGTTTVIIGESGSGKSVLLKLMMRLLRPDRGRVCAFGRDLGAISEVELLELRRRMGMVFQSYALFDGLSAEENVAFALREGTRASDAAISRRARELLQLLGLEHSEHLLPAALSGGMKKRLGLARALVLDPEVILLDEPTTGLDPIMVEKVDQMIRLARQQRRTTTVVVSHDLASVKRLADRVAFLHDGRILFTGTYEELIQCELPPVHDFVAAARPSSSACRAPVRSIAPAAPVSTTEAPVVELIGVYKDFGANHVLRGIDLAIPPRKTTCLIGASGSGKSVLIKHIMGLLRPSRGEIRVFGQRLADLNERELDQLRRRFSLVFQHAALLDWLSVEDNVAFPLVERRQTPRAEIRARVAELLERLGLVDLRRRMPGELSVGQRKRVALARAIVVKPEVIIYDEPTTGQDPLRSHGIDDMIMTAQDQFELTSIVISHDMTSAFRIADRIAMLHEGTIAAFGTPAELRASTDPHVLAFLRASTAEPDYAGGSETPNVFPRAS